jgi:hypothetical protein
MNERENSIYNESCKSLLQDLLSRATKRIKKPKSLKDKDIKKYKEKI